MTALMAIFSSGQYLARWPGLLQLEHGLLPISAFGWQQSAAMYPLRPQFTQLMLPLSLGGKRGATPAALTLLLPAPLQ